MSRRPLRRAVVASLAVAVVVGAAACGETSKSTTTTADPSATDAPSSTAANTPEAKAVAERGKPTVSAVPGPTTQLKVTDDVVGTGTEVKAGDTVTVQYVGAVAADGKVFDESWSGGQPVTFSLDQVIPGWSQGLVGMKAGGRRTLVIPADQAYGANPPPGSGIPANADLVFVVDLVSVP